MIRLCSNIGTLIYPRVEHVVSSGMRAFETAESVVSVLFMVPAAIVVGYFAALDRLFSVFF